MSGQRAAWGAWPRVLRRLPLMVSGGVRRFAEDPWRGWAAARRAVPGVARFTPDPRRPLARVERAAAEDRLADALDAFDDVREPSERVAAERAISRLRGHYLEVATVRPRSRAERRQVEAARRHCEVWSSPLPRWAGSPRSYPSSSSSSAGAGRPNVLHVVTNSLPRVQAGSTIRTQRIAAAQGDVGWRVGVATRPGFPVFHGDLTSASERVYQGVRYHSLLPAWMPSAQKVPQVYARLLDDLVMRERYGLLHAASDHVNARAALEVGHRRDIPVLYEARTLPEESWLSRHGGEQARDSDAYRWMRARHQEVLLAADAVTTLGSAMRDAILEMGVHPERIFVVPNAVPEGFCEPATPALLARDRLGIDGGDLLLGTVTTMYSYEGLELLIAAAEELRRGGLDARLLLVGDGPERDRLLEQAETAGVPVSAPGRVPVDQVTEYLDALDVFVLPRREDAITALVTALKPLEAQARGIPVVGSDLPAVAEVLAAEAPRVAGRDPRVWAQALARYADPGLRSAEGAAAREWVRACRTWPTVMEGYASAYAFVGSDV